VTNATLASAGAHTNAPVGSYAVLVTNALGAGLSSYMISYSNAVLAVTPAVLMVKAENKSRSYGQTNPLFTMDFTGFVNGEEVGVVNSMPTASTAATPITAPGAYPITLTGGAATNYSLALVPGTLTISWPGNILLGAGELLNNGQFRITGKGDADVGYKIEASTDLQTWEVLGTATADETGAFEYLDTAPVEATERFYRVATP